MNEQKSQGLKVVLVLDFVFFLGLALHSKYLKMSQCFLLKC